jgi:SET domain
MRLKSHLNDFEKAAVDESSAEAVHRWEGITLMSKGAHVYSGTSEREEFVRELYARVLINSHTLVTPTFDPLGICLDPLSANMNHSCNPNAVVVFDGLQLCVRSLVDLAEGQEITISYIDNTNSLRIRRRELTERYFFLCSCIKCSRGPQGWEDDFQCVKCRKTLYLTSGTLICADCPAPSQNGLQTDGEVQNLSIERLQEIEDLAFDCLEKAKRGIDQPFPPLSLGGVVVTEIGHVEIPHDSPALPQTDSSASAPPQPQAKGPTSRRLGRGFSSAGFLLSRTKMWPRIRQPMPSIMQQIQHDKLQAKNWLSAKPAMLETYFTTDPIMFPQPHHPVRVVHTWTLAQVFMQIQAASHPIYNQTSIQVVPELLDIVVIIWALLKEVYSQVDKSHGKNSHFAGVIQGKLDEVGLELARGGRNVDLSDTNVEKQWNALRKMAQRV